MGFYRIYKIQVFLLEIEFEMIISLDWYLLSVPFKKLSIT